LLVEGIHHRTRRPYSWPSESLKQISKNDLTAVSRTQIEEFKCESEKIFEKYGKSNKKREQTQERSKTDANADLDWKGTPEEFGRMCAFIPNDDLDWDDWIKVGMAMSGAMGEVARDTFHAFSEKSAKYDPETTDRQFDGFEPHSLGAGTLVHLARQGGYDTSDGPKFTEDQNGKIRPTRENVRLALEKLGVRLAYNQFTCEYELSGLDPHTHFDDVALAALRFRFEERFGFSITERRLSDVLRTTAIENWAYHPVLDWLDGLTWDGVSRLGTWLTAYLGASDNAFIQAVGRLILVAAVRRVRRPGAKFDQILVLEGPQGLGKSTAVLRLLPNPEWFLDDFKLDADAKLVIEQTAGKLIVEVAELRGKKADIDKVKAALSRAVDRARLAYGRLPVERPRQFVLIGTVNDEQYLKDITGNRRFWPVRCGEIDLAKIEADSEQIWAEVAELEAKGISLVLPQELWAVAAAEQEARRRPHPFEESLAEDIPEDFVGRIPSRSIWDRLDVKAGHRHQGHNDALGEAMTKLGFTKGRMKPPHEDRQLYCYWRGDKEGPWYEFYAEYDEGEYGRKELIGWDFVPMGEPRSKDEEPF